MSEQSLRRSNKALHAGAEAARVREAGLLEARQATAADAHTLRASRVKGLAATEAAAAAAARDPEVRNLEETAARLYGDAQERAAEAERRLAAYAEQAATLAEERNTWALRSTEWEAEVGRLDGELVVSQKQAADLQKELEAAVAKERDQVASRWELEQELRAKLQAAQVRR